MTRELDLKKTAVFSFDRLTAREEPRSYDVDEPTRELPLIAGRFAGREWIAEELRSEPIVKFTSKPNSAFRRAAALALGGVTAAALLVGALMGQAELIDMNEEAVVVSAEISALREEQNTLLLRYAELSPAHVGEDAPAASEVGTSSVGQDKATVLNIRHGRELGHMWESFVDTLGASFR